MADRLEFLHLRQFFGHAAVLDVDQTERGDIHRVVLEVLQVERLDILGVKFDIFCFVCQGANKKLSCLLAA